MNITEILARATAAARLAWPTESNAVADWHPEDREIWREDNHDNTATLARIRERQQERVADAVAGAVLEALVRPPTPEPPRCRGCAIEVRLLDDVVPYERHPSPECPVHGMVWEYETTEGQRKAWYDADTPPPGEGWERDLTRGRPGEGWDRFNHTEESYWRRQVWRENPPVDNHDEEN